MNLWTLCQHPIAKREMRNLSKPCSGGGEMYKISMAHHSLTLSRSSLWKYLWHYLQFTPLLLWFYATIRLTLCIVWKYLTFTVVGIIANSLDNWTETHSVELRTFYQYDDVMCRHSVSEDDEVISWSEDGWIVTSVTSLSESGRAPSRSEPGRAGSDSDSGLLQQLPPRVKRARPGRGDQLGRLHWDTEGGAGGISGRDIDWIYFYNFYVCVCSIDFLMKVQFLSLLFCGD